MESTLKRTWAEIDLDNLAYNFAAIRRRVGSGTKLLGVVKANAYGHGAVPVAKELEKLGAGYLAVACADEAEELRAGGVTLPVLILGFTPAEQTERLLRLDVTQAVQNVEIARAYDAAAAACGGRLKIHVKLDTGMGRLGFQCDEAHFGESLRGVLEVCAMPHLDPEGVFTHFAVSDETGSESEAYTEAQHERFVRMVAAAEEQGGFRFRLHHCCNSGAIAYHPEWAWDMVRCGIILYGTGDMAEKLGFRPVMTLKTTVASVKDFGPGESVSYGRLYRTSGPERIAVLTIGYADGLFRALSGRLRVRTPYGEAAQVGRICMDMCMIDAQALPQLRPGDEAEIFGEHILCEHVARLCGTISYELLCAVSKRVPREYLRGGKRVARTLSLPD